MAAYTKDDHETGVSASGISDKKSLKFILNLVKLFERFQTPTKPLYDLCPKTC